MLHLGFPLIVTGFDFSSYVYPTHSLPGILLTRYFFHDLPLQPCVLTRLVFLRPLVGSAAAVAALLEAGPLNRFGLESTYYNKGLCGQR